MFSAWAISSKAWLSWFINSVIFAPVWYASASALYASWVTFRADSKVCAWLQGMLAANRKANSNSVVVSFTEALICEFISGNTHIKHKAYIKTIQAIPVSG